MHISQAKYKYVKSIIEKFPELEGQEEALSRMRISDLYKLLTRSNFATGSDLLDDILDGKLDSWNNFPGLGEDEDDAGDIFDNITGGLFNNND